jgi:hypothetical protein
MLVCALVSLIVDLISVLLHCREAGDAVEDRRGPQKSASFKEYIDWLYHFLVFANSSILLIGTMLRLISLFEAAGGRSCLLPPVF